MPISTIFTVLFYPYIAQEHHSERDFVSSLRALRSLPQGAPSLPQWRFAQERRAIERFQWAICPALIKIPMQQCCKPDLFLWKQPCQIPKWGGSRFQNGPLQKISIFRGALDFLGPKMALGRTHLETYNRPHLVIWSGRFYKTTPGLQHRSLNSYNATVL